MKKLTALVCIFLCSLSLFATTIKVMSFNVNGQENNIRSNEIYANNLCTVVKESGADIVLMQEFRISQNEPELFRNKLGASWQFFSTKEYIKKDFKKFETQNNVIFYNTTKVSPTYNKDSGIVNFKTDSKYKFVKNNTQVVEFCLSGEPSKTFVAVNIHLPLYTKNKTNQSQALSNYKNDLNSLETLYSNLNKKGCRIIIGGDFNTKRTKSSGLDAGEILLYKYPKSKLERFPGAIVDSENQLYCFTSGGLLTSGFDRNQSRISPTLDIDHFIIRNLKVIKDTYLCLGYGRMEYTNRNSPYTFKINGSNLNQNDYRKRVSDHLPIMIELEL